MSSPNRCQNVANCVERLVKCKIYPGTYYQQQSHDAVQNCCNTTRIWLHWTVTLQIPHAVLNIIFGQLVFIVMGVYVAWCGILLIVLLVTLLVSRTSFVDL